MELEDKIKQIIELTGTTPTQFADEIGIPRPSISHILAGRNKASLEVVRKVIVRYPQFGTKWFLEGENIALNASKIEVVEKNLLGEKKDKSLPVNMPLLETVLPTKEGGGQKEIDRILIFFKDGTFKEYLPS